MALAVEQAIRANAGLIAARITNASAEETD
jgi:hypothetical protein